MALIRTDGWSLMVYVIFCIVLFMYRNHYCGNQILSQNKKRLKTLSISVGSALKQLQSLEIDTIRKWAAHNLLIAQTAQHIKGALNNITLIRIT